MKEIFDRAKYIFYFLKQNPNGLTGEMLSTSLQVSSRTIRTDIKLLRHMLSKYKVEIISTPREGYSLQAEKSAIENAEKLFFKQDVLKFANNRIDYIIFRLLENCLNGDTSITQNELSQEMFISLSTLKLYLKEAESKFKEYSLEIVPYKLHGIKLLGEEINIRYCIVDYMNMHQDTKFFHRFYSIIDINALDTIIKKVLSSRNLQLTDMDKNKLCTQITTLLWRAKYKKLINYDMVQMQQFENTFEFVVSKEISEEISNIMQKYITLSDIYYITQCMLTSKKFLNNIYKFNDQDIKDLIKNILLKIKAILNIDFTSDEFLIEGLSLHLNVALTRIGFNMNIRNELLETIKIEYPLAFQIAIIASKYIEEKKKIKINDSEIGYIALHFGAALSRNDIKINQNTKKIILICETGIGTAILLKARIEEIFQNRLNIIKVLPVYELKKSMLEKIDFLLTTVPIKNFESKKIIKVNHFLQKEDIDKIEAIIFNNSSISLEQLEKFFRPDCFYTDKSFPDKNTVLDFLTSEAVKKNLMTNRTRQSVYEREKFSPTNIGNLLAIPHPLYNDMDLSFISVCVLKKPIQWNTGMVQLIFLLNIKRNEVIIWEKMFINIYRYVKKNGVKKIIKNSYYDKFLSDLYSNIKKYS
ncbi:BglG family transcription antiterminator [Pectinatus frisingensis]|uniref:BglG family transcription antiterminator n=1 Tax=Pectinatus frisingensis TaxID=865 RepID=UPI0018C6B04C|nr:PRD domain-containing protein [Pectinatus frisingensis]